MEEEILRGLNRLERGRRVPRKPRNGSRDGTLRLFLGRWLRAPHRIGALAPSSRYLAYAMAREVDVRHARLVVELGGGTGSITRGLLAAGLPQERLIVVERDERLYRLLRERFPELLVLKGDATELVQLLRPLGIGQVSAVVSGLPLLSMPKRLRHRIVEQAFALMGEKGALVQFTYGIASPLPEREFPVQGRVRALVWRNLPPAFVWRYERHRPAMARVA